MGICTELMVGLLAMEAPMNASPCASAVSMNRSYSLLGSCVGEQGSTWYCW